MSAPTAAFTPPTDCIYQRLDDGWARIPVEPDVALAYWHIPAGVTPSDTARWNGAALAIKAGLLDYSGNRKGAWINRPIDRVELIALCTEGVVRQDLWRNRDSAGAQRQLGEARALLAAGCEFHVIRGGRLASDEKTIWVEITWHGFSYFEYGSDATDDGTFYIPTRARLDAVAGGDWY